MEKKQGCSYEAIIQNVQKKKKKKLNNMRYLKEKQLIFVLNQEKCMLQLTKV